jgi:SAM-dependent methyltransferase
MKSLHERYTAGDYLAHNPSWDIEDSPWKAEKVIAFLSSASYTLSSICEIGCGGGGVLAELRRRYPETELFGFDVAPDAARFWTRHASANIKFQVGDFFKLNQQQFDLILVLDVIEHLPDPFDFLSRLRSYAKLFLFHIPLDLSAINILRERPLLFSRRKVGHIHYFCKGLALELLKEAHYKIVDWRYTRAAFTSPQRNWKTILASYPRRLAYALNKDLGVRLLGGETLMILAQAKD